MGILLLLLGILAGLSGGAKLRGHARTGLGRPALAWAEVACGVLLVLGSAAGLAGDRPAAWAAVVLAAGAVTISSFLHLRKWRDAWRRRERSEGARLESYVKRRRRV